MATTTQLAVSLPAVPASVRAARGAAGDAAEELGADKRTVDDVRLCVSEAVANVVRHAYGRARGAVEIVVEREDGELAVVVHDDGVGMARTRSRTRASGGFGLKIIERIALRMAVTSGGGTGTEIRMSFSLPAASRGR